MEAVKVVEYPEKIVKEDFMGYLKSDKARQLLDELWPFIKLDSDGRILYIGDDGVYIPGSPLVDLIEYTMVKDRGSLYRPFDIKKFWSILAANNVTDRVESDKKWIKLWIFFYLLNNKIVICK